MITKVQRRISYLLLGIIAFIFCGNNFFVHSHQVNESQILVHSHPYIPGNSHTHTSSGFSLIAAVNILLATALLSAILAVVHNAIGIGTILACVNAICVTVVSAVVRGRAPPVIHC